MPIQKLYINGEWVESTSRKKREIINPFNQEVIATATEGNEQDVKAAILTARNTFDQSGWKNTTAHERGKLLYKIASLIERDQEELARLETLNTGKTLIESEADMVDIAEVFRYFAGLADKNGEKSLNHQFPIHSVGLFVNQLVLLRLFYRGTIRFFRQLGKLRLHLPLVIQLF